MNNPAPPQRQGATFESLQVFAASQMERRLQEDLNDVKTRDRPVRLTRARWDKLGRLGSAWLNKAIDQAKEPPPKE